MNQANLYNYTNQDKPSIHIQERVQIQQRQRKFPLRLRLQELQRHPNFCGSGGAPDDQAITQVNLLPEVRPGLNFQSLRQGFSLLVGEGPVEQFQRLRRVRTRLSSRATHLHVGRVEDLHERQTQIPLGDQINAAAVMLSRVFGGRPLGGFVERVDQPLVYRNHHARPALLGVKQSRHGQDRVANLLRLQTLTVESP